MTDTPAKPSLSLLPGNALKTVDDIAAFYKRITGKDMTEAERQYAREKLGEPEA
jgi:hypothetical protein